MIQEKARQWASKLNLADFKASNGWLESFMKRNLLMCKKLHGEAASVDTSKLPKVSFFFLICFNINVLDYDRMITLVPRRNSSSLTRVHRREHFQYG